MTLRRIGGLPFWQVRFDAAGDADPAAVAALLTGVRACAVTDLVVFAHGWNNDGPMAATLYDGFLGLLAAQARRSGPWADSIGLLGVHWPARRWPDEPVPNFPPGDPLTNHLPAGAATVTRRADDGAPHPAGLDDATLRLLRSTFPAGAPALDRMAALLLTRPTPTLVRAFATELRGFALAVADGFDDGESGPAHPDTVPLPGMLAAEPTDVYRRFLDELRRCRTPLAEPAPSGAAALADPLRGIWHGAKEALRQLTYWQMKNRAGVVGQVGLGPVLDRLPAVAPGVRVHLVGHSFGARLVSFAAAHADVTVRSVTLLQGALSRYAFAPRLPFAVDRRGALAGLAQRIDGPVVVCRSVNDAALAVFYPLASVAAGDDAAALPSLGRRWGALGYHGASAVDAVSVPVAAAGDRAGYRLEPRRMVNIDVSAVVRRGGPPAGAHSDIVHPELSWLVLAAGGLVGRTGAPI